MIFDGNGNYALFDVRAADHTYFEGITFRNSEIAILAGTQFIAGAQGLTVKRSRFEDVGAGVFTNYSVPALLYCRQSLCWAGMIRTISSAGVASCGRSSKAWTIRSSLRQCARMSRSNFTVPVTLWPITISPTFMMAST